MNTKQTKTLKRVEELLNMSDQTIQDCELSDENEIVLSTDEHALEEKENHDLALTDDSINVFELTELKSTFLMVKQNLRRLVNHGQMLMDQTSGLSIDDMKASEISAIADLSNVVATQLKMLVETYKDIISTQAQAEVQYKILNSQCS